MIKVRKYQSDGPLTIEARVGTKYSYMAVENAKMIATTEGEMLQCSLISQAEFANPETDVAIYVGKATVKWHGQGVTSKPKIYFWEHKFWTHARQQNGTFWYKRGLYVLYEIQIENEALIAEILSY